MLYNLNTKKTMIKLKLYGPNAVGYMITFWTLQLLVCLAWIFSAFIPGIKNFGVVLTEQLNTKTIDIVQLLKPFFWIGVWGMVSYIMILIVALVIFKIYKSRHM